MERLTQRIMNYHAVTLDACKYGCAKGNKMDCPRCKPLTNALFKLAEYEDAEEQGLLAKVVHGEWIIEKSDTCYWYACSECGGYIPLNQYKKEWYSDFCPNCGAKMDGKEEGVKNGNAK